MKQNEQANARLAEKYIKKGEAEKYCKMLGNMLAELDIKRRAVERTGIASFVSELEQVILSSFEYGEISKMPYIVGADRKKGSAVSSNYSVTHLYFGSDRIFLYSYVFSVIGRYAREEVAEICYRDIVCARAVRETCTVGESAEGKGVFAATARLVIGLASGDICIPCGADGAELNRAVQLISARR